MALGQAAYGTPLSQTYQQAVQTAGGLGQIKDQRMARNAQQQFQKAVAQAKGMSDPLDRLTFIVQKGSELGALTPQQLADMEAKRVELMQAKQSAMASQDEAYRGITNRVQLARLAQERGATGQEQRSLLTGAMGEGLVTDLGERQAETATAQGAAEDNQTRRMQMARTLQSAGAPEHIWKGALNGAVDDVTVRQWLSKPGWTTKTDEQGNLVYVPTEPGPGTIPVGMKTRDTTPKTDVTVNTGKGIGKFAEKQAEILYESWGEASDAVEGLTVADEAISLLDNGVVTGFGANTLLGIGKALERIGVQVPETVSNTEAYMSLMGKQVANIIKDFGAGTGLSDADREYARMIAGGDIKVTEKALRKILSLYQKGASNKIKRHNRLADQVMNREGAEDTILFDPRVQMPSQQVRVVSPDGTPGRIPANQLDAAMREGYRRAD